MTPKEQYEARKAERNKRREAKETLRHDTENIQIEELFGRFVTAVERIADVLETRSS